jgi:hypothetical protein
MVSCGSTKDSTAGTPRQQHGCSSISPSRQLGSSPASTGSPGQRGRRAASSAESHSAQLPSVMAFLEHMCGTPQARSSLTLVKKSLGMPAHASRSQHILHMNTLRTKTGPGVCGMEACANSESSIAAHDSVLPDAAAGVQGGSNRREDDLEKMLPIESMQIWRHPSVQANSQRQCQREQNAASAAHSLAAAAMCTNTSSLERCVVATGSDADHSSRNSADCTQACQAGFPLLSWPAHEIARPANGPKP